MAKPSFSILWKSYPTVSNPCDDDWRVQCAIRMSITLNTEGTIHINKNAYSEPKCSHGHARGAESLANWLWKHHLGRPKIFPNSEKAKKSIKSENGLIFFKDCFIREGEVMRRGDHIDLWKLGITLTFSDPGNQSRNVWFWELS